MAVTSLPTPGAVGYLAVLAAIALAGVVGLSLEDGGFRDVVDSITDPLFVLDGQDRFAFVNGAFVDLFGGTAEAVEGKHLSVAFSEAAERKLLERTEAVRRDGGSVPVDVEVTVPDGTTTRVSVEFHPHDTDGVTGIVRQQSQREGESRETSRYERIVETIGDPVYVVDADGTLQFVNEALVELTGYPREMLLGSSASILVPQEYMRVGEETIRGMVEAGDRIREVVEMGLVTRDGERVTVENKITLLPYDETFRGHAGVIRDISERERRRAELEQYETIVEAMAEPIYVVDAGGTIQFVNSAFEAKLGYDGATVEEGALDLVDVVPQADVQRVRAAVQEMVANPDASDRRTVETTLLTSDGRQIPVETNIAPITAGDEDGFSGAASVARDISERKEREQRLEVVDRVFRHNFRNSLGVIKGGALELQRRVPGEHTSHTERIISETTNLESLSEKAHQLGELLERRQDRQPIELTGIVQSVVTTFAEDYPAVTFDVDAPSEVHAETVDGIRFAISNLVENAVEHNDTDGLRVEVTVDRQGDDVHVTVADNGAGIPQDEIEVFERGEEDALLHGSGIGLWAVNWIVQRSYGEISFETSEMCGGAVVIRLRGATPDTGDGSTP